MNEYLWIVIVGGFFAFFAAMGIGANDVANAYATSVGSKALTVRQAVGLATICETSGAILMGSHVSETIRKGIADYRCFESQPELLMYGCMWVIFSVGLWLFLASYLEMPVSTTHSCVGGMIGMAWALGGINCVIWYKPVTSFPYVGGVSGIVLSWVLSPVASGFIATALFYIIRGTVLRKAYDNVYRIYILYPVLVGSTLTLNTFFIIYKGAKGIGLHKTDLGITAAIAVGAGVTGACAIVPCIKNIRKKINKKFAEKVAPDEETPPQAEPTVIDITDNDFTRVNNIHNSAEKFDPRTEELFRYLQIFTAMCDSFSHGANDVANAIGPFAAIYTIYQVGDVRKNSVMDANAYWILTIGGLGISIGLFVYGYKIIVALGTKLCKITPSRGVAIELSSAIVIITGSRLKIPLSTTHCQVGATVGVGLLENMKTCSGINSNVLLKTILGWFITCIIVGSTTAVFVLQGVKAPSSHMCITNTTV
jgi:solute carrier family 20 (sodium-dependent phosphate transporter)